jgi:MFS family permease
MTDNSPSESAPLKKRKVHYGWVIVAACTLLVGLSTGLMFSYSVFFKPLAEYFSWDRGTVSFVYSAAYIIRGAVAIGIGWLADKYSIRAILVFCGIMAALGLILSSQVNALWQMIITFAVIEAIGLSGAFSLGTTLVSRWFTQNRGLALGIVSTGSGLGTLFIVPISERLISSVDWSQAFLYSGIVGGVIMIGLALLLRPAPSSAASSTTPSSKASSGRNSPSSTPDINLRQAIRDSRLLLIAAAFFLFFFSTQIVIVHLVNYATDVGISPAIAATFISIVGAINIVGRLGSGFISDRIGINMTMIMTISFLTLSFVFLLLTRSLWSFYLFAVVFSVPYGAEVPLLPLFIGKYFGTKNMATLLGFGLFLGSSGGALGAWVAGAIFDFSKSYQWAFIAGAAAGLLSLALMLILRKKSQLPQRA